MNITPEIAKIIVEKVPKIQPVFAEKGERKGQHVKYTYRYEFPSNPVLNIAIVREPTEAGITFYINNISASGSEYKSSEINGIKILETYKKGFEGKNGNKGIRSSVAKLTSLNPKENDVLRLSASDDTAFHKLLEWYFDTSSSTISSLEDDAEPLKLTNFDENHLNESVDDVEEYEETLGYQIDPKKRKCVELYAEDLAVKYYKDRGFSVEKKGKPFDLLCKKSNLTIHVEVKGTTGLANKVILTRNEVEDAKDYNWQSDLFVVKGITLEEINGVWHAKGGTSDLFEKWAPEEIDLVPISFEYNLPKNK